MVFASLFARAAPHRSKCDLQVQPNEGPVEYHLKAVGDEGQVVAAVKFQTDSSHLIHRAHAVQDLSTYYAGLAREGKRKRDADEDAAELNPVVSKFMRLHDHGKCVPLKLGFHDENSTSLVVVGGGGGSFSTVPPPHCKH
jgi:hypothetical protein